MKCGVLWKHQVVIHLTKSKTMKKANVNLFDKNKVKLKLLKNKSLRISDGRKHPTKIINLRKTGITIWTDGKHLKVFRGDLLTEVIGRTVYRANKFETVEFAATKPQRKAERSIKGGAGNIIGATDLSEGRSINGGGTLQIIGATDLSEGRIGGSIAPRIIGATDLSEGRSIKGGGTLQIIGATDLSEGRVGKSATPQIIGATDLSEGRVISDDILIISATNGTSEGRSIKGDKAISITLNAKSVIVKHGKI